MRICQTLLLVLLVFALVAAGISCTGEPAPEPSDSGSPAESLCPETSGNTGEETPESSSGTGSAQTTETPEQDPSGQGKPIELPII